MNTLRRKYKLIKRFKDKLTLDSFADLKLIFEYRKIFHALRKLYCNGGSK